MKRFLRRLCVAFAGMVLFGLTVLLSLPVEAIAGTKLKLIETIEIPYGKGEGQLNTPVSIDIDKPRGEMYIADFGGERGISVDAAIYY